MNCDYVVLISHQLQASRLVKVCRESSAGWEWFIRYGTLKTINVIFRVPPIALASSGVPRSILPL